MARSGGELINPLMENHIQLNPGFNSNSYISQFQVAQLNFYLFSQEEKMTRKRYRLKNIAVKAHEPG